MHVTINRIYLLKIEYMLLIIECMLYKYNTRTNNRIYVTNNRIHVTKNRIHVLRIEYMSLIECM